ncbi:MAG: protoporphyrinogen oxidase [Cyanobacteria bacterium P01_D01_bin.73]
MTGTLVNDSASKKASSNGGAKAIAYSKDILDVVIVGAGLTGLTTAHELAIKSSTPVEKLVVLEAADRVGGCVTTKSQDGFLWEEGPNSFSRSPELLELIVDVGLRDELVLADRKLPRFVYWDDQLQAVPMSPGAFAKTSLITATGKIRLLLGATGLISEKVDPEALARGGEETVREFFTRHLGAETVEKLVIPFVSGVYAGDVNQLSGRSAFAKLAALEKQGKGSLAPGAVKTLMARKKAKKLNPPRTDLPVVKSGELGSFKGGLRVLPDTIAAKLGDRVKLKHRVVAIDLTKSGTYRLTVETPDGTVTVTTRSLLLATPTNTTGKLLQPLAPKSSEAIAGIPYPTVACVTLAYPKSAFKTDMEGFGNLIPRSLGITTLGTIWTSSLFPGRAPQGWQSLINFIGGSTNPAIANMSEGEIVGQVHQDVSRILLNRNPPQPRVLSVRVWDRAIPQYTIGHQERLDALQSGLDKYPGLFAGSNYMGGVAVGDCVKNGLRLAGIVAEHLKQDQSAAKASRN